MLLVVALSVLLLGCTQLVLGQNVMTTADKIAVLNLHNQERCNAPNSPNFMPAIFWDTDLEAVAQAWINTCPENDISNAPYKMGSNWAGGSGGFSPLALAQLWAGEKAQWTYTVGSTGGSCTGCGHYTQMVWANSMRVGCATNGVTCSNSATQIDCVYSPAGNFNNQVPYPISGDVVSNNLKSACSFTAQSLNDTAAITPYCSSPCQNGGTCVSFEYCKCGSGFTGNFCEQTVSNGNLPSIYTATFSCNTDSDCSEVGGGSCCDTYLGWGFGLTCKPAYPAPQGYTAATCPQPQCSTPCQNGGTCVDTNVCACQLGTSGATCASGTPATTQPPVTPTHSGAHTNISPVLALGIAVFAVFAAIFC